MDISICKRITFKPFVNVCKRIGCIYAQRSHTHKRKHIAYNSGLTIKLCNTAHRTKHQALQHFLERPRNKVGGALLFFVASRDLWWGRARMLQNI